MDVALEPNQIACCIEEVRFSPEAANCDRCGQEVERVWEAERVALDLHLDRIGLLLVLVGVYHCASCQHYFRAQPPFLRPGATYTNRVVSTAVQSVFADGMAFARVPERMARDFWLRPSEATIRGWCRQYADGMVLDETYDQWIVSSFSGVLCVDEVYQGSLALLLAVDPAGPDGDRLVGYQLVHGSVDQGDVEDFLERMKAAGIEPDEVVTDGSALYPSIVKKVWASAAHQLCLFHETRLVVRAVMKSVKELRSRIPKPPSRPRKRGRLRERYDPDAPSPADRSACIARVLRLRQEGVSLHAIASQTGHSRNTVRAWLRDARTARAAQVDDGGEPAPLEAAAADVPPNGSVSSPSRQGPARELFQPDPPPLPWHDWDEVRRVGEELRTHRYVIPAYSASLGEEKRQQLDALLDSPLGAELRPVHEFAQSWFGIWRDENGARRSLEDARSRFTELSTRPDVAAFAPLVKVQAKMDDAHFTRLSQFLRASHREATSNGAERMARVFRHLQASRFKLRTDRSIEDFLSVHARRKMNAADQRTILERAGRSTRGRRPRTPTPQPSGVFC